MKNLVFLAAIAIIILGCKKDKFEYENAAFEISCNACSISYDNDSDQSTQFVNTSFKKDLKPSSNANITVTAKGNTTFRFYLTQQEVYSMVVSGTRTFRYDYKSNTLNDGTSTRSFGSPKNTSNSKETSKKCGARTKDGGSCQRLVSGGGPCWQHK